MAFRGGFLGQIRSIVIPTVIAILLCWIHCTAGTSRVCTGTTDSFSQATNPEAYMMQMRKRYTNCTYVVGNLELVFMDEMSYHYDLSFLSTIKEVTGYVLIVANKVEYIPLHNLRIIRGHQTYNSPGNTQDASLFISINNSPDGKTGLRELRFTKLTEILNGRVFFQDNRFLCFDNTIHWRDINPNLSTPVRYIHSKGDKRQCGECHPKCHSNVTGKRHCWGEGPDMCQELTKVGCHLNCGGGRCYGSAPNQCCHHECAGGCTGPLKTDCFACRNMRDEGGCVVQCPPLTLYDQEKMMMVRNANPKYAYGSMCVSKCPEAMLIDEGFCVNSCPDYKKATDGKHCEKCEGGICPKKCSGLTPPEVLDSNNIHHYEGCSSIVGDLRISPRSFIGDKHRNIEPLHPSNLTILKTVKEITGSLVINILSELQQLEDLSFLSNLEVIHGRIAAAKNKDALHIMSTPLQSLELKSLKSIRNGDVFIVNNKKLCYVSDIDWKQVVRQQKQNIQIQFNRNPQECIEEGKSCHDQCDTSGCWGPGPDNCIKCRSYEYEAESLCLNRCSDKALLFPETSGKCAKCHSECANSCTGRSNTDCDACVNVMMRSKDGVVQCLPECVDSMYPDENHECQKCHRFCGINGCTGDSRIIGEGGCNGCEVGRRVNANTTSCMSPDTVSCQDGYYMSYFTSTRLCEKCHPLCVTCTGSSSQSCDECKHFKFGEHCVAKCPNMHFGNTDTKRCEECHHECLGGCTGNTTFDCTINTGRKTCVNVMMRSKDGVVQCLPECGDSMYPDENNECQKCHRFCGINGCTGDSRLLDEGGCNGCVVGLRVNASTITCMNPDTVSCQDGYYMSSFTSTRLCEKCHPLCVTCTGSSSQFCDECKHFKLGEHCVAKCPNMHFSNTDSKRCKECHQECRGGCTGNTTFDCTACSNFKIYQDPESSRFNCTPECPPDLPFTVRDEKDDENRIVCADENHPEVQAMKDNDTSEEKRKLIIILCSTVFGVILILALVACIGFFCFRRAQNKRTAEFTAKTTGTGRVEMEPLAPTSTNPDLT